MCQTAFTKYQSNMSVLCTYFCSLGSHFKCAFFYCIWSFCTFVVYKCLCSLEQCCFLCYWQHTYHGAI